MRKGLLFIFFILYYLHGWSQLSMTLQVPPTGVMLKSQLWNLALVNTSSVKDIEIELVLTDVASGQVALTGTTNLISVNTGAKQITASDIIVSYDYPSSVIVDHNPDGYLTIGTFNACYTVHDKTSTHSYTAAEECIDIMVEPLSPPLLNMPCDGCFAESKAPLFSWLAPSPLNLFNTLTYEMKLVELFPNQATTDAIQYNAPVLLQDGNPDLFLNYPASGALLDTTKTYAWQIVAKNNGIYAAQSDIWTFSFFSFPPDSLIQDEESYITYRNTELLKGIHVTHSDTVNIKYYSSESDTVSVEFLNADDNIIYTTEKTLAEGENFLTIQLPASFKKNIVYSFRFRNLTRTTAKLYFTQQ